MNYQFELRFDCTFNRQLPGPITTPRLISEGKRVDRPFHQPNSGKPCQWGLLRVKLLKYYFHKEHQLYRFLSQIKLNLKHLPLLQLSSVDLQS